MNTKLNCPVCGYQELTGNICPNCDTDLALIRTLHDLLPTEKKPLQKKINSWTLGVGLLMLIIGISLGAGGSFVIMQTRLYNANIAFPNSILVSKSLNNTLQPKLPTSNIYIVKPGDNLSLIAEKFCGNANAWEKILKANPQLQNRKNYYIDPEEELKIPNCQETTE